MPIIDEKRCTVLLLQMRCQRVHQCLTGRCGLKDCAVFMVTGWFIWRCECVGAGNKSQFTIHQSNPTLQPLALHLPLGERGQLVHITLFPPQHAMQAQLSWCKCSTFHGTRRVTGKASTGLVRMRPLMR